MQLSGNKLVSDAIALLELLNESEHTHIKMDFTRARCGRANWHLNHFTIPEHALKYGESYLFYYVIHEYTHIKYMIGNHKTLFKKRELELLHKYTNIESMDYARAYPKVIYANGQTVYKRKS